MPSRRPSIEDARRATEIVLAGLARGTELPELVSELAALHPENDTFPGEVFLALAVDVLEVCSVDQDDPLDYEGLHQRFLPEVVLRGRNDHHKSFYTLTTPPALRGGLAPDLLGEVQWWRADDYWIFALYALVIYVRAAAKRLDEPVQDVCQQLAEHHRLS